MSFDLTPVLALVLAASGRAALNRLESRMILINFHNAHSHQVMAHLMQVHKSITTLQGEDIVFLATDINLPGKYFTST